jgi:calcineurin-like phosphoesterase family protein
MGKKDIFKHLKAHYNYVVDKKYNILFVALQGSQNYNLDDEESDVDSIVAVLPSYDDLILGNVIKSTTLILPNNEHVDIIDIRNLIEQWKKQNTHFLQILFTDYKIINKDYKEYINTFFEMNEDIANINRYRLYKNIFGIIKSCYNSAFEIIEDTNSFSYYDRTLYMYKGKPLSHLIRLSILWDNLYLNHYTYKDAIKQFSASTRKLIIDIKREKIPCMKAFNYGKEYANNITKSSCTIKENYNHNNIQTINNMYLILKTIINEFIKKTLNIKSKKLDISKYNNVFVTADTHFGHVNILKYENRSFYLNVNNIEEHDQKLIDNWNKLVTNKDLVIILGDFSFYKAIKTMDILDHLNGDKLLIEGNHDCIYLENKIFDKTKFIGIYDYLEIKYKGQNICLMHYPISDFKHMNKTTNSYILIHGHIHSLPRAIPRHGFNAGVDVNQYKPIKIEQAIKYALKNENGIINKPVTFL